MARREEKMTEAFSVYAHPELVALASKAADEQHIPLSEFAARVLADHFGRPDLREIPRKQMGRPRKNIKLDNGKKAKVTA